MIAVIVAKKHLPDNFWAHFSQVHFLASPKYTTVSQCQIIGFIFLSKTFSNFKVPNLYIFKLKMMSTTFIGTNKHLFSVREYQHWFPIRDGEVENNRGGNSKINQAIFGRN